MSAGLDSLGSVEFSNVLAQKLGMQMPGTLVFDYPSIRAVTDFLTAQLLKSAAAAGGAAGPTAAAPEGDVEEDEEEEDTSSQTWAQGKSQADLQLLGLASAPQLAAAQRPLAVLTVVTRPVMGGSVSLPPGGLLAGVASDHIHRVPFERWDLDMAEALQHDTMTLSAQANLLGGQGGVGAPRSCFGVAALRMHSTIGRLNWWEVGVLHPRAYTWHMTPASGLLLLGLLAVWRLHDPRRPL